MAGKQVTELDALPSFTDTSLLPVHNGAGLKKGLLSQLASYLGNKFSNPNLLINPDFKINQRGQSTYNNNYTLDRWKIYNCSINASSKTIINSNSSTGNFVQPLENKQGGTFTITVATKSLAGTVKVTYRDGTADKNGITLTNGINTFTFTVNSLTWVGLEIGSGASVQLDYIKLEQGTVATSFIAPNPVEEYPKCQRYFQYIPKLYCVPLIYAKSLINASDKFFQATNGNLPTEMRTKQTLTYKTLGQSDNSTFTGSASFEFDSKSINTVTLDRAISNFTITINAVNLDAEIY